MTRFTGLAAAFLATSVLAASAALAQDKDVQKQIDDLKNIQPKFAIPMREVGDRWQNMYFAAKGGNWALAAYMSKYMNGAMKPASLTKPDEYKTWKSFYESTLAPVTKAIDAKDMKAFETAYNNSIAACNGCHAGMGYGFIKVVKLSAPADNGIDYKVKSNPGTFPHDGEGPASRAGLTRSGQSASLGGPPGSPELEDRGVVAPRGRPGRLPGTVARHGGYLDMTSTVRKRSILVHRHKTSVSLEDAFWEEVRAIAHARNMTLSDLVSDVARGRRAGNLSSALRLMVLESLQAQAGERPAGSGR